MKLPPTVARVAAIAATFLGAAGALAAADAEPAMTPSPITGQSPFPERLAAQDSLAALQGRAGSAARALFAAGIPDPLGLPYHDLELPTGICWSGDGGVCKTRGWLLPADGKDGHRFAIGWNGLVYPVVKAGAAASLAADVKLLAATGGKATNRPPPWERGAEAGDLDPASARIFKAVYLARLGHAVEADRVAGEADAKRLAAAFASDWAWSCYERAVCAHMRGDDHLARASLLAFQKAVPALLPLLGEKAAAQDWNALLKNRTDRHPIGWAWQFQSLLDDAQRRLAIPPREKMEALDALSVGELIARLDDVAVRQDSQPGGVNLESSPIVRALVKKGDAAVEPLLDCLGHDARLTRSVQFWRDFARNRTVLAVHEAAFVALQEILQVKVANFWIAGDNLTLRDPEGRAAAAKAIRDYFAKYRHLSREERWRAVLADDSAGLARWCDAALAIVAPVGDASPPGLQGEILRDAKSPGVTQLLIRRYRTKKAPVEARRTLSIALAKWDAGGGRALFDSIFAAALASAAKGKQPRDEELGWLLELLRYTVGHAENAAPLFSEILLHAGPKDFSIGADMGDAFGILHRHRDQAWCRTLAGKLFASRKSPWLPLVRADGGLTTSLSELVDEGMLDIPEFRQAALSCLADQAVAGELTIKPGDGDYYWVEWRSGGSLGAGIQEGDAAAIRPGGTMPVRVCDATAAELDGFWKRAKGPNFEIYWTREKRDAAIAAWAEALRSWKERP